MWNLAHSGFPRTVCVGPVMLRNHARQPRPRPSCVHFSRSTSAGPTPSGSAETPNPQGIRSEFDQRRRTLRIPAFTGGRRRFVAFGERQTLPARHTAPGPAERGGGAPTAPARSTEWDVRAFPYRRTAPISAHPRDALRAHAAHTITRYR
jgi:hypothetical protein